ncbi:NB-ARC domain-containing protein [Candidatus Paracaedibacter symbiosus]|uniref:NB-ARC domain-containing protein n=1 Tax=Candidatus Paracaedibacter symbiosus TaxID=244582 RepID=UPI000509787F|nr:NB-ARC domain-containing protein [Candidatus Paracaedibacter symbiosus]
MMTYLRFIILGFYPWLVGISSLQAMDNPEIHDLRQGQGPEYIEKLEPLVTGTSKLRYTFCYQPSIIPKDSNREESLPKIPYTIPDGLAAKVTQEEPESFTQSFSSVLDTRREVQAPSQWPHCVHGHLMMRFGDECLVVGSGILVGPNHVLTAGHNLFDLRKKSKWASEVWFSPGRKGSHFPFGYSKGSILLCHNQWLDPRSRRKDDYDLGMIILNQAIGNKVGWSGLLCASNLFFHLGDLTVTGYPGEKGSKDYYSTQMWEKTSRATSQWFGPETIEYEIPTSFGQSGGAIWRQWPTPINPKLNNILTIGIHTEGNISGRNKGVRLTSENFNVIIKWIRDYHLKEEAPPYELPQPAVARTEYLKSADEWWAKGNIYDQDQKDKEAFTCFYTAVKEAGDKVPDHMLLKLAERYSQGKGTEQNYLEAFTLYMQLDNPQSSPKIMFLIGKYYLQGLGVPKDIVAALYFLEAAAGQDNSKAIHELYRVYSADGEYQNLEEAKKLFDRAKVLGKPIPDLPPPKPNPNALFQVEDLTPFFKKWGQSFESPSIGYLPEWYSQNFIVSIQPSKERVPLSPKDSYLIHLGDILQHQQKKYMKVVITGLGGIGKSELALAYAHLAREYKLYEVIHWIDASEKSSLIKGYRNLLREIKKDYKDKKLLIKLSSDADEKKPLIQNYKILIKQLKKLLKKPIEESNDVKIVKGLQNALAKKQKCLLIYDNASSKRKLKGLLPDNSHIIITSRRGEEGWDADSIPLNVFRIEEAIHYLFMRTKLADDENNHKLAETLAHKVECLPLALAQAASYIELKKCGLSKYIEDFKVKKAIVLNYKDKKGNYPYTVATTWQITMNALSPLANQLMYLFAYLNPNNIPIDLFTNPRVGDEPEIEECIDELVIYSMIKRFEDYISVHRLVQRVARVELENSKIPEKTAKGEIEKLIDLFADKTISIFEEKFDAPGVQEKPLTISFK